MKAILITNFKGGGAVKSFDGYIKVETNVISKLSQKSHQIRRIRSAIPCCQQHSRIAKYPSYHLPELASHTGSFVVQKYTRYNSGIQIISRYPLY